MIGRRVRGFYASDGEGVVIKWEPLSSGMCDALVRHDDGREVWHASHGLRALDGAPLPSRSEAIAAAEKHAAQQLRAIRAKLVADWHEPWPGLEHGKAILGQAIDGALAELGDSGKAKEE